jgi:P-type conjugative transfer protein TrbL
MKSRIFIPIILILISIWNCCYAESSGVANPNETAESFFNEVINDLQSALQTVGIKFMDRTGFDSAFGGAYAASLFWALATLSLAWTAIEMALKRAEFGEIFSELAKFILVTGFFYYLATEGSWIALDIIHSFERIAGAGAGWDIENTSNKTSIIAHLWKQAQETLYSILSNMRWTPDGWFKFIPSMALIVANVIMIIVAVAIFLIYILIAIKVLIINFTLLIQVYAGIFLLGFGGGKWTRDTTIQYFRAIISTASQYLAIILIISAMMEVGTQSGLNDYFTKLIHNDPPLESIVAFGCAMLLYPLILLFVSHIVPSKIAQLFSGNFTSMNTSSPQQTGSMISKGYGQARKATISVGCAASSGIEKVSQLAGRKYESARNSKSSKGSDNSQNSANSQNTENMSSMNSSTEGGNSPAGTNTENSGNPTAGTGNTENSGNQSQSGNNSNSSNPSSGSGGSGATPSAKGSSSTSSNASPSDSSSSGTSATSASSGSSAGSTSDNGSSSTGTTSSEAGTSASSDSQSANSTASSQQPQGFAATAKMYATKAAAGAATVAKAGARAGKAVADVASATSFIPAVSAGIGTVLGGPAGGVVGLAVGGSIQTALGNKGIQAGAFARNQTIKAVGASMKAIGTGLGNVTHCHPIKAFNAGREQYHRQQEANINTNNSNTTGGNSR